MVAVDESTDEVCGCRWTFTWEGEVKYQIECERHVWASEQKDHIKISIESDRGNAYVSEHPYPGTDLHYGHGKHTDTPVIAKWSDDRKTWLNMRGRG